MYEQSARKYFYAALFIGGTILTVMILWPFAKVLIVSMALTAVLNPVYAFLKRTLKVSWVAAFLTVLAFVIVLCVPLFTVGTIVFHQSQSLYGWVVGHGGVDMITSTFNQTISRILPGYSIDLSNNITAFTGKITASIGLAFTATLATIFSLILVILSMFYFLKDGNEWKKALIHVSPLSDKSSNKILSKLNSAVNGVIKGYLLIAVAQGFLMGIGLYIFGVPHAALWAVLAGIASLIPTIGTSLVSIPSVMFLLIMGRTGAAIGLGIWALVLVGTIDNMLNPLVVGRSIDIHPLLILFSVLGGVALLGPAGILIGPLAISFMYALVSVYKDEIREG